MRLPRPFYRLPVRFDPARLQAELEALPDTAWARHPEGVRRKCVDPPDQRGWHGKRRHARRHATDGSSAGLPVRAAGARELWRRVEPVQVHALECPVKRARARGHELSLVSARASPHSRDHVARSHLQMRRRKRPHGSRRSMVVRQLAPPFRRQPDRPRPRAPRSRHLRQLEVLAIRGRERRGDAGGAAALPSGIRCPGLDGAGRAAAGHVTRRGRAARPGYRRRVACGAGCAGDGRERTGVRGPAARLLSRLAPGLCAARRKPCRRGNLSRSAPRSPGRLAQAIAEPGHANQSEPGAQRAREPRVESRTAHR